ncbi:MAG: dethiobiotin synthase [Candidatus Omnitrophota bacterium]|nr:dethiobiotin synthase [Candidatus Omnitrophota bacterium]
MVNSIFITGTDTGVGKTVVTAFLGGYLSGKGVKVVTQKWIQTGCAGISGDVAFHTKFIGSGEKHLEKYQTERTPYVLEFPSSPHLAALLEKKHIDAEKIERAFLKLSKEFDLVLVEGTGGFMVPINDEQTIGDIVKGLCLPVLVVAENRLGAINQTLLTVEALRKRGLEILGIVFNRLSKEGDRLILEDNLRIVKRLTGVEVLGELPFSEDMDALYRSFLPVGEKIFNRLN